MIPSLLGLVAWGNLTAAAPNEVTPGKPAGQPESGAVATARQVMAFPDPRITVSGLAWWKEEAKLKRLPDRLKASVPPKVWQLSQSPAGARLRFRTDSLNVGIHAVTGKYKLAPSPPMALIGMDLYSEGRYLGSALPDENAVLKKEWTLGTERVMRDVEIYLPMGSPATVESLVLDQGARLEAGKPYSRDKPVVYYGSSITQGAQATNPGGTFPCLLGRWLDTDFVNLGFSGNGMGEPALARAVAEIPAAVFVIDYWANPAPEVYEKTFPEFIAIIRVKFPDTPIVVTGPYYNPSEVFGSRMGQYQLAKRLLIPKLVEEKQKAGDKNIHYVDGLTLISAEQADALSDARHANSYGMFLYARGLEPVLRKVLGMPVAPER
ncbi:SGNH/GDSL hydrolase family protein [Verrucomicrobium sp. BvORR106]|uniref:SGNH/GDSL hydrolase family protein n=1 Tax=Verrucomicrobium sp. BvORR106 TaxID=1403819 RepID=UPI0005704057|nr:SGNH/GDSL hydrolase family protein [Verrucomicrobium sp. BvORR106]